MRNPDRRRLLSVCVELGLPWRASPPRCSSRGAPRRRAARGARPRTPRPQPTAAAGVEQFTPVVMRVMSPPRWFAGGDGRVHLVYELELSSGWPDPVSVTGVKVRDAANGQVLLALSGDPLKTSMSLLTSGTDPTVELPAS